MTPGPRVKWGGVKGEIKMIWVGSLHNHNMSLHNAETESQGERHELVDIECQWQSHWRNSQGCGVRVGSQIRWSRMFSAGVGVVFLKLLELESGFQKCWSRSQESES